MGEMMFLGKNNVEYVVLNVFYNEEYDKVYALYARKDNIEDFFVAQVINNKGQYEFIDIDDEMEFEMVKELFINMVGHVIEGLKKETVEDKN